VSAETLRDGDVARAIRRHRRVVVLRRVAPRDRLVALVEELVAAGARLFEITFDAPEAADDIGALLERFGAGSGDILFGAGTVMRAEQLDAARRAGAAFAVAPVLDPTLIRRATDAGTPFVPGVLTPTEAAAAWAAGATFVKLFPASAVGPAWIRELHGPMPELGVIPTGGVDGSNAQAFLDAGAAAVGIGSALVRADAAERRAIVQRLAAAP
jgi:2-dehydro-3-deoxyphosphogluconate aldolase/(4S)-4-hydroxy-2-oxoglutarate aldolase